MIEQSGYCPHASSPDRVLFKLENFIEEAYCTIKVFLLIDSQGDVLAFGLAASTEVHREERDVVLGKRLEVDSALHLRARVTVQVNTANIYLLLISLFNRLREELI